MPSGRPRTTQRMKTRQSRQRSSFSLRTLHVADDTRGADGDLRNGEPPLGTPHLPHSKPFTSSNFRSWGPRVPPHAARFGSLQAGRGRTRAPRLGEPARRASSQSTKKGAALREQDGAGVSLEKVECCGEETPRGTYPHLFVRRGFHPGEPRQRILGATLTPKRTSRITSASLSRRAGPDR